MSHVIQVISDAVLAHGFRPFATLDRVVRECRSRLSILIRPRSSSLRVSQRWLEEHEWTEARHPPD